MSWARLRRLQRIYPFHGHPGRFAPRAAVRGLELAAQSQFLTLFASLTPARAVLSGSLHACTGRLAHSLQAQAASKTPTSTGPLPRGAPQVAVAARVRLACAQSASRRPQLRPAGDLSSVRRGRLRLSGARWRRLSRFSSRPDPLLTLCRVQQAVIRSSAAIPELHARLTCVAIVSCDRVVGVV